MGIFIKELILEGFRNFERRTKIKFKSPLTAIVGKNSTGKSSVLSAIDYLYEGYGNEKGHIECITNEGSIVFGNSNLRSAGVYVLKLRSTRGVYEPIRPTYSGRNARPDFISLMTGFNFEEDEIDQLNSTLLKNYDFKIRKGEDERFEAVFKNGEVLPAVKLSAGMQSLLAVEVLFLITNRYSDRNYLILIEEIENFLHPTQLRRVIKKLKLASDQDKYQIIMTTHSPFVVSYLEPENIIRISPEGEVYQLEEVSEDIKTNWHKLLDANKSEVFFADKVLIYEGLSDKLIIEGALKYAGLDLNDKDIVSIKLDGLYHYEAITNLLRSFNIPYLAIVDKDPRGRNREVLEGRFITVLNPYGEIEDAVPLEDWIRILKNNERDCELYFLINLLEKEEGQRFSDAVARSFGKNKLSYSYRLGELYSSVVNPKDRGVQTFVEIVKDFVFGREIDVKVYDVDLDISSKHILLVEENLGMNKEEIIDVLHSKDLFPEEIIPFMMTSKHYSILNRKAVPILIEKKIPFVAVVGNSYNLSILHNSLTKYNSVKVRLTDEEKLEIVCGGIKSFLIKEHSLDEDLLLKCANFDL